MTPAIDCRGASSEKNSNAASTVIAKHVGDRLVPDLDLQRLGVVAGALASGAGRVHAGKEQQFDADEAFALAGLATPLGDVERESAGVVAPGLRLFGRGEQFADVIEQSGICRQVRAGSSTDGLLVDHHQPLDAVETRNARRLSSRPVLR